MVVAVVRGAGVTENLGTKHEKQKLVTTFLGLQYATVVRRVEKWDIQTFWLHFLGVLHAFVFQSLSDPFFKTLSLFFRFGNADCAKDKHNTKAVAVAPGGHPCLGLLQLLCNLVQTTLNEVLCPIWLSGLSLETWHGGILRLY